MRVARLCSILVALTIFNLVSPSLAQKKEDKELERILNGLIFDMYYLKAYYGQEFSHNRTKEEYKLLVQKFTRTINDNSNNAMAYHNRGYVKDELGDYRGAIEDFNRAIQIDSSLVGAYSNRGISKANLKNFKGAIDDFDKVIELEPVYLKAYYNRGVVYYYLGEYTDAIKDFDRVLELKSIEDEAEQIIVPLYDKSLAGKAYLGRAASRYELGQRDSACLDLSKAGETGHFLAYTLIERYCNRIQPLNR